MIGGLAKPTGGQIWLEGEELTGRSDSGVTKLRHDKIGFVFQRFNLLPTLSALENVGIALNLSVLPSKNGKNHARPEDLLETVGLGKKMHNRPSEMSIGEQQRVAIARALVRRPTILLADEPTGSLDRKNSDNIMELLKRLHSEHNQTIIMVTHDPATVKDSDRVLNLLDGQLQEG